MTMQIQNIIYKSTYLQIYPMHMAVTKYMSHVKDSNHLKEQSI